MRFELIGVSDCPLAKISLSSGESVKVERGAMAYMQNVALQGKMNSQSRGIGGLLGAIGRSLTSGESMFITEAVGTADNGVIGIAPAIPGKIHRLSVGANQYRLNTGAFLASDSSVSYAMKSQNVGKAFFGGTGGLFVMETQGQGDLLVNAFGDLVELAVTPGAPVTIDNEHVVAWDASLNYEIAVASGSFGFTTGEGLVNRFEGSGRVLIQTRNIHALADALQPFLPDSGN